MGSSELLYTEADRGVCGSGSLYYHIVRQSLISILLKTTVTPISMMRSDGMHNSGSTVTCYLKRGVNTDKPVKGPVWQTDEVEILLSKNGVHAHGKY